MRGSLATGMPPQTVRACADRSKERAPAKEIVNARVMIHGKGAVLDRRSEDMSPSEAQLRTMIDTIPALAWFCLPDGSNEFTNKRWRDYTGLSQAEALGLGWQQTFHPDDLGKVMENWRAVHASGEPSGAEARMQRTIEEFLGPGFDQTVIHPDDWHKVASTRQRGFGAVQFELEARMKGKDGQTG